MEKCPGRFRAFEWDRMNRLIEMKLNELKKKKKEIKGKESPEAIKKKTLRFFVIFSLGNNEYFHPNNSWSNPPWRKNPVKPGWTH